MRYAQLVAVTGFLAAGMYLSYDGSFMCGIIASLIVAAL